MSKKISKADLRFNQNVKREINSQKTENKPGFFPYPNPIYIPNKKKKK